MAFFFCIAKKEYKLLIKGENDIYYINSGSLYVVFVIKGKSIGVIDILTNSEFKSLS